MALTIRSMGPCPQLFETKVNFRRKGCNNIVWTRQNRRTDYCRLVCHFCVRSTTVNPTLNRVTILTNPQVSTHTIKMTRLIPLPPSTSRKRPRTAKLLTGDNSLSLRKRLPFLCIFEMSALFIGSRPKTLLLHVRSLHKGKPLIDWLTLRSPSLHHYLYSYVF